MILRTDGRRLYKRRRAQGTRGSQRRISRSASDFFAKHAEVAERAWDSPNVYAEGRLALHAHIRIRPRPGACKETLGRCPTVATGLLERVMFHRNSGSERVRWVEQVLLRAACAPVSVRE